MISSGPDFRTSTASWRELCRRCNERYAAPDSWWRTLLSDPEIIARVDADGITLRLRGNLLARVELHGQGLHCRIPPEYLVRIHPGSLTVLREDASATPLVSSLDELNANYALVRRRACALTDRRRAVLDRLFLRHGIVLAVDMPLPPGNADLVTLHPEGRCAVFLLRCYADPTLRLAGPGGAAHALGRWRAWLQSGDAAERMTEALLRSRTLHGPLLRRFERFPDAVRTFSRPRLLLVDFDHAQRLSGLRPLLDGLTGLDPELSRDDILAVGDPGNITIKAILPGS